MAMLTGEQLIRFRLAARSAQFVVFRPVLLRSGELKANKCHENVAAWVAEENPDDQAVRGWLDTSGLLDKHSIVSDSDGEWFDITPLAAKTSFFRHPALTMNFGTFLIKFLWPHFRPSCLYHGPSCVLTKTTQERPRLHTNPISDFEKFYNVQPPFAGFVF